MWNTVISNDSGCVRHTIGDVEIVVSPDSAGFSVEVGRRDTTVVSLIRGLPATVVRIVPVVPDRPVLLLPDRPISVVPGGEYNGSFLLPVWVRLCAVTHDAQVYTIDETPSVRMKKTWFGGNEAGEPAYRSEHMIDTDRRAFEHECLVPFRVQNSSGALLLVERLLVRVVHLDMFVLEDSLRTNAVSFDFRGRDQESRISFQKSSQVKRDGGVKISSARSEVSTDIIKKSFYWIRELAV